jgi:hypothetical protein
VQEPELQLAQQRVQQQQELVAQLAQQVLVLKPRARQELMALGLKDVALLLE